MNDAAQNVKEPFSFGAFVGYFVAVAVAGFGFSFVGFMVGAGMTDSSMTVVKSVGWVLYHAAQFAAVTQVLWVIPLYRSVDSSSARAGVLSAAAVVFLINGSCWLSLAGTIK